MRKALGIDMGGTKIELSVCLDDGSVLSSERISTGADRPAIEILNDLVALISKHLSSDVLGVGIGTPGFLGEDGLLYQNPNIPSLDATIPLLEVLAKEISLPLFHENDGNCFALAEYLFGAGKGCSSLLAVVWGTGVGGGFIHDGHILHGASRGAFEIGHMVIDASSSALCNCGRRGDLEAMIRGDFLLQRYLESGGSCEEPTVPYILDSPEDNIAVQVRAEVLQSMALGLANLVHVVSPERIVLGGGFSKSPIFSELQQYFDELVIPAVGKNVHIVPPALGQNSGSLGAACLVFDRLS